MRTDYDACVRRFIQDEAGQFLGVFQAVTVRNIYCLSRFIHTFIMVFLCKFADGLDDLSAQFYLSARGFVEQSHDVQQC